MRKLIIVLLCLFTNSVEAQLITFPKLDSLQKPLKPSDTTVSVNGKPFILFENGYVVKNQKIVLLNANSPTYINFGRNALLDSVRNKFVRRIGGAVKISDIVVKKTCDCSPDLVLLEYSNLHSVSISPDPDGSSAGSNNGLGGGEGGFIGDSQEISDEKINQILNPTLPGPVQDDCRNNFPVKVAYLDGGIKPNDLRLKNISYREVFYQNDDFKILRNPNSIYGKNFANYDPISNPYPHIYESRGQEHGKNVSYILTDMLDKKNIKVMPLRIFNNGTGELFDALCAMLYAQKNRFDILNCSWGHGGAKNPVFQKVMRSLEADKIMVVCSAGNECRELGVGGYNHYPAMFSDSLNNVITVSTVRQQTSLTTSKCGNFSSIFVNLACLGDVNYRVNSYAISQPNPIPSIQIKLWGTSYSAAKTTGLLARNYLRYLQIQRSLVLDGGQPAKTIRQIFLEDNSTIDITPPTTTQQYQPVPVVR